MERAAWVPEQVEVILFDVIGTLVDENASWVRGRAPSAEAGLDESADLYTPSVALLERHMDAVVQGEAPWWPHRQLVSDFARDTITAAGGNPSPAALAVVADLDSEYSAWPDVAPATAALRRKHLVVGVSNGDLDWLARLANANAISWDTPLSTAGRRDFPPGLLSSPHDKLGEADGSCLTAGLRSRRCW